MVYFEWEGVKYRTDFDVSVVERLDESGVWTRVWAGRVIRSARMAVNDWIQQVKEGKRCLNI